MSVSAHRSAAPSAVPCFVLTVSDTRTLDTDKSGATIVEMLSLAGHTITDRRIVKDDALAVSDRGVFFKGGSYDGDLTFGGSRVTLFGEGLLGGKVVLNGNITVSGSDSRIRGADITGTLSIPASKVGVSFSKTTGMVTSSGSDSMFLQNRLCGTESITGSGVIVVGNTGAAPLPACP